VKKNKKTKRWKSRTSKRTRAVTAAAGKLLADPSFLHHVCTKLGDLGIIGEERNRLIFFLAALTATLEEPVSAILKGSSSSGKSNLLRKVIRLLPPECVKELSSLSKKAPVYGEDPLVGMVLFLMEYHGGKEAQYLIRLLQSEGGITHEATSVRGQHRSTTVTERVGRPVVLTTTTESKVYRDDETRFLSASADESEKQTQAILKALVRGTKGAGGTPTEVFQEAVRLLRARRVKFDSPAWLEKVAECVPCSDVRVRRDWGRFLTFCKVIALCRSFRDGRDEK
jgi:hypothetical protein